MQFLPTSPGHPDTERAITEVERELGPVDTLVNCAGLVRDQGAAAIWDLSDADWQAGIEGILNPAFYCSRAVAKGMCERGRGKIVNISSGLGMRGARDNYMYACAKGAIIQLTRSLAVSLGRWGVTSNCIVPGFFPHRGHRRFPDGPSNLRLHPGRPHRSTGGIRPVTCVACLTGFRLYDG